jgi:hypothetical protein
MKRLLEGFGVAGVMQHTELKLQVRQSPENLGTFPGHQTQPLLWDSHLAFLFINTRVK